MKKVFYVLLIWTLVGHAAAAQEVLTNKDIISLANAKVSGNLITQKIKTSKTDFLITSDALIELFAAKVPDYLVNEMLAVAGPYSLKNEDIVKLHTARVPRYIILQAIEKSRGKFDMSVNGLILLQQANLPENYSRAMLEHNALMPAAGNKPASKVLN